MLTLTVLSILENFMKLFIDKNKKLQSVLLSVITNLIKRKKDL